MKRKFLAMLLAVFALISFDIELYEADITEHNYVESEFDEINKMSVDEIMGNSTAISTRDATIEGTYKSGEKDAGLTGYTYSVSFDWVAKPYESDYIFTDVSNVKVTVHANHIILNSAYSSYYYQMDVDEPSYSSGRDRVVICITFDFYTVDRNNILGIVNHQTVYKTFYKSAQGLI